MKEKHIERFWDKVMIRGKDECWEWMASKTPRGCGQLNINGKTVLAHRISAHIAGRLGHLDDKKVVCHICDNPGCVNPNHLFVGTQKDNIRDCIKKGRFVSNPQRGEQHGNSKLTGEDVIEIRRLYNEGGLLQREIASLFGVCRATVGYIITGKTWRHI